jgi:hypothetical protein
VRRLVEVALAAAVALVVLVVAVAPAGAARACSCSGSETYVVQHQPAPHPQDDDLAPPLDPVRVPGRVNDDHLADDGDIAPTHQLRPQHTGGTLAQLGAGVAALLVACYASSCSARTQRR